MQGCRLAFILIALSLLGISHAATDALKLQQQPNEDNLLILGLKVDYLTLEEVLPAYRMDSEVLLPLGILSQILDIAIKVDLGTASAEGFIIKEDRQFHLDAARREVVLNGQQQSFPEARCLSIRMISISMPTNWQSGGQ